MDRNDGVRIALAIKWKPLCFTTGFGESKYRLGTLPPPLVKMIGAMAVTRPPRGEWAADRTYGSTVILTKVHPAVACSLATL